MKLTARQRQIAELILRGRKQREIAVQLGITLGTVKIHAGHIRGLLGLMHNEPLDERPRAKLREWIDQNKLVAKGVS